MCIKNKQILSFEFILENNRFIMNVIKNLIILMFNKHYLDKKITFKL